MGEESKCIYPSYEGEGGFYIEPSHTHRDKDGFCIVCGDVSKEDLEKWLTKEDD